MKAILIIDIPKTCCECAVSWWEVGDFGDAAERLVCLPLTDKTDELVPGNFLNRRHDCPLMKEGELNETERS